MGLDSVERTNAGTIFVENEGGRSDDNGQTTDQATRSSDPKLSEHLIYE